MHHGKLVLATALFGLFLSQLTVSAGSPQRFAADFSSTGTTNLIGRLALNAKLAGLSIREAPDGRAGSLTLQGDRLKGQVVNIPLEMIVLNGGPRPIESDYPADPEEPGPAYTLDGPVTLAYPGGHLEQETRILPNDDREFDLQGFHLSRLEVATVGAGLPSYPNSTFPHIQEAFHIRPYPLRPFFLAEAMGWMNATVGGGNVAVLVAGPEVSLPDGAKLQTGMRLNSSRSVVDPLTGSGRYVYDNWVLVIQGQSMRLAQDHVLTTVAAREANGTLEGKAFWHGIQGKATLAGVSLSSDQKTLEIVGNFGLHSQSQDLANGWGVQGTASSVAVDTKFLLTPRETALAATAATGIALLAALLFEPLRGHVTFLLGRSTPTLFKAKPLGSRTRRAILKTIHERQPVTLADIEQATGLSRGALRYNLRILTHGYDILQSVTPNGEGGRNVAYMLNSGSLMFQTPGIAEFIHQETKGLIKPGEVLSRVNGNPLRREIHAFLLEHGDADYEAIRDHLRASGVVTTWPQSSASYQLGQLEKAGAIASRWVQRRKVYAANVDPNATRPAQYANYLRAKGVIGILEQLHREGPMTLHQLRERTRGGSSVSTGEFRKQLQDLEGLALLRYDDVAKTYALETTISEIIPTILGRTHA